MAELRARSVRVNDPEADRLIRTLRARSAEFERMWQEQRVAICRSGTKTLVHPESGMIDLQCQILRAEDLDQLVVIFTPAAGSRAAEQLRRLSAVRVDPRQDGTGTARRGQLARPPRCDGTVTAVPDPASPDGHATIGGSIEAVQ
ncbi:hypothetical protein [Micromonospora pisi]|uniref:MmyB family transcriptional regulator n=1 Tax=Micromonospora pisi TaxID=589240 RepID=UPI00248293D2|nr:hypothetical protein [Micromonospora pisi]